ncbi:uncharacterized protein LAESUDRAFT_764685 [Laetiporus sulphureus 93-53]|uniref:GTP binding protein 2 n=1 Tax=Laetiporus sulphureus 93-53 TaxID=1314785 RepID=A0A165B666_9APHY|nr:uncharacterized protein LAESUDRAFT_764685 [Laetiporus sulphureus 93-53]KZT00329.1 hypothetical protein LAESUDRAFT_764685 [Laetiporus sulphureus 93-53]
MFGEHESESPRVPSPWDPFLPSPPAECAVDPSKLIHNGVPKLVPEADEGNVEYKLKLTNISPARFARLVTQLKWRLLEGGGQAYYELGVADSGALIGLTRNDLERSLETLEMMAGEIGASVIVVKEIEIPPAMYALAEEVSKYLDPDTGEWTRKMKRKAALPKGDDSTTTTETETELSTTDLTDFDDFSSSSTDLITPADLSRNPPTPNLAYIQGRRASSNPNRPAAESSPFIEAIDDDLALFSMEPELPHSVDRVPDDLALPAAISLVVDIEIASVFKPRPMRRRELPAVNPVSSFGRHDRRQKYKGMEKTTQPWHKDAGEEDTLSNGALPPNRQEAKMAQRRLARDRKREEKRKAVPALGGGTLPDAVSSLGEMPAIVAPPQPCKAPVEVDGLAQKLDELQVTAIDFPASVVEVVVQDAHEPPAEQKREPRLIVEALVVRKLSIEEAFLDFGGFQLV